MRRILFLDFDGVLNSRQFMKAKYREWGHGKLLKEFDPVCASNLLFILESVPDCEIVVSSSWRIKEDLLTLRKILLEGAGVPETRVIGKTPSWYLGELSPQQGGTDRGLEIQAWLDTHAEPGVEFRFVIVDDNSDMAHLMPNLVQTSWDHGLLITEAEEIIKRFAPTSECNNCRGVLTWAGGGLCDACLKARLTAQALEPSPGPT